MSFPAAPLRRAGSLAAALTLAALAPAACSPDAAHDPLAPVSTLSADGGVASGHQRALPFQGTLEATESHTHTGTGTALIHGGGRGTATHLGRFTFEFDLVGDLVTGASASTMVLTAANGDLLTVTGSGQAAPAPDFLSLTDVETMTITGGTGRFEDAAGTFVLTRVIALALGETYPSSGSFEGSITLVH